jgi:hypothetical protein
VLDLPLSKVSGFDVPAAFLLQTAAPPVIIITGLDEPGSEERTQAWGMRLCQKTGGCGGAAFRDPIRDGWK